MKDLTLDSCCAREKERENKNAEILKQLKQADPVDRIEKEYGRVLRSSNEFVSRESKIEVYTPTDELNTRYLDNTIMNEGSDSNEESDFLIGSDEELLWSKFRDLRMSKIVRNQEKIIKDQASCQFILPQFKNMEPLPIVFIVSPEGDVFSQFCKDMLKEINNKTQVVQIKPLLSDLEYILNLVFQKNPLCIGLLRDKTNFGGIVFGYFNRQQFAVDRVFKSSEIKQLSREENKLRLTVSLESLEKKVNLIVRNMNQVEDDSEEETETYYDCGRDGCRRAFFHQHMK